MERKAVGLVSGGLDSILAAALVKSQGIEVVGLHFIIPFAASPEKERSGSVALAQKLGMKSRVEEMGEEFLAMLEKPAHGYGRNVNPCIDCHALMLRRAREVMAEEGASFVFTGEVLGERPMSQHRKALGIVEAESGLAGLLLRPLSALLLPATRPEEEGVVDRSRLYGISGRSRKPQMRLAEELGITEYPGPAGGCLLTDAVYSKKVRDLMRHGELTLENARLLSTGRHYRLDESVKLVVGRDREENLVLESLARGADIVLSTFPVPGPVGLLRGPGNGSLELSARICAAHSDAKREAEVPVTWRSVAAGDAEVERAGAGTQTLRVAPLAAEELERYRV
jgi:tRNA U34 2-thiouridine synthase MnmA/TrmU